MFRYSTYLIIAISALPYECASSEEFKQVRARTDAGWVCGVQRTYNNKRFASFVGVPYSSQPVGNLRFKELQPAEPWEGCYDATTLGPICPQQPDFVGSLMTNTKISEACVHANVYVPIQALPRNDCSKTCKSKTSGLPILVFIHGGGFSMGSGDPDFYGPEYLVFEDIIVFTINYRLNVFGFFTIPSVIPPNNGLRDMRTFLKWLQVNARNFGGNPKDVTLMGQSAGGIGVHLLSLSKATKGLFNRVIITSGVGIRSYFTATPKFANETAQLLLSHLGINSTDSQEILQRLIALPVETLMNANYKVQAVYGPLYFLPVVEERVDNFTTIIDDDPEILVKKGRGKDIPLVIGFMNVEWAAFVPLYTKNNVLGSVASKPQTILPPDLSYKLPKKKVMQIANDAVKRCFNGSPSVEKYLKCYINFTIAYPAIKLAQMRASIKDSAPVYLYQFSYNSSCSPIKETKNISYDGSSHFDDLAFYFRTNLLQNLSCFQNPTASEIAMRERVISYVKNFINCNDPSCSSCRRRASRFTWPAETSGEPVKYENFVKPSSICYTNITKEQANVVQYLDPFYDELYNSI